MYYAVRPIPRYAKEKQLIGCLYPAPSLQLDMSPASGAGELKCMQVLTPDT